MMSFLRNLFGAVMQRSRSGEYLPDAQAHRLDDASPAHHTYVLDQLPEAHHSGPTPADLHRLPTERP